MALRGRRTTIRGSGIVLAVSLPPALWTGAVLLAGLLLAGCEAAPLLDGEPTVVLHDGQPMVVDVRIPTVPGARVTLIHDSDTGVEARPLDDHTHRIRCSRYRRSSTGRTDGTLAWLARGPRPRRHR